MKKAFVAVVALALSGSALGAPFVYPASWTATAASEVKTGGTYRISTISDFKTLNPFTTAEATNIPDIISAGGFLKYDPVAGEYIPYLAESYTVSKDKLVWTFNIRKGVKWSDGKPMVADDWVTTYKIHTDEDVGSNSYDSFFINDKPVKVTKVDNDTVKILFPTVDADAVLTSSFDPWPNHVFGSVYAAKGAEGIKAMWKLSENPDNIVSSGDFRFASYKPGERATFEKNPTFGEWNKDSAGHALPYLDGINYGIYKDINAQLAAYRASNLDTFGPNNADHLRQIKGDIDAGNLKAVLKPNVGPAATSTWIVFNWNRKSDADKQFLFRNENFRRAMSHLSNRAAMIDIAYGSLAQPAYSSVYAAYTQWISPNLKKFDYNLEAAKALLTKIGYTKKNSEGYLVNRAGKVLEFDLTTNAGNNIREQLAKIFVDEAKKVGVKVNFKPIDFNSLVGQLLSTGDDRKFDSILLGLSGGSRIFPLGQNVEPCGTNLHAFNQSGKCLAAWETQVTALYARGRQELNTAKRIEVAQQIQNIQSNYQAWDYLVSANVHFSWNSRVKGEYPANAASSVNGARDLDLTWIQQ